MQVKFYNHGYVCSCPDIQGSIVLNLPATVSLIVLISPRLLLHVRTTVLVEVTVSFDVSVTGEVSTLHRTVVYGPEDVGTPVPERKE